MVTLAVRGGLTWALGGRRRVIHFLDRHRMLLLSMFVIFSCIQFKYSGPLGSLQMPGLFGGLVILGLISFVVLYRLDFRIRKLCQTRGIKTSAIPCQEFALIPLAACVIAPKGHWSGQATEIIGGFPKYQWDLVWSSSTFDFPFLVGIACLVMLFRASQLTQAILDDASIQRIS